MKVFVYGSLKRGKYNNYILGDSKFIGMDRAPGVLYTGSHYPMAIPGDGWITGEVFEVTDPKIQRDLDRLEGHPSFYERQEVTLESGLVAWIYYWKGHVFHNKLRYLP